jgi:hypothetical protein
MFNNGTAESGALGLTLYTDSHVIRGSVLTMRRRVTDVLNDAENDFLVITDVVMEEFGGRGERVTAECAQVNLHAILFAVADTPVEPLPEFRLNKQRETALVSVPPFSVIGRIHLMPEREMRQALAELTGRFLPVTEATFWSESVGAPRTSAHMVAVNHARAHILAPYQASDPWAGLAPSRPSAEVESDDSVEDAAGTADPADARAEPAGIPTPETAQAAPLLERVAPPVLWPEADLVR